MVLHCCQTIFPELDQITIGPNSVTLFFAAFEIIQLLKNDKNLLTDSKPRQKCFASKVNV